MVRSAIGMGIIIAFVIIVVAALVGTLTDPKRGCVRGEVRNNEGVCVPREQYRDDVREAREAERKDAPVENE